MIWLNTGLFILIPLLSDIILDKTLEVSLFKLSDDADKLNIKVSQSVSSFLFQSTNNNTRLESEDASQSGAKWSIAAPSSKLKTGQFQPSPS